ncbi:MULTISPECIES: heavy-metal-associated domain-containing protein [Microbacterium]|jgi:copper chaperone|uniref:heavy-metal-associated domain-containing protein n=1 Tax=Microbacterium TaxID=33882 RepID=UPI001D176297|nr:heavy-metal-associated domain-containing protein [Microbacterium testaceum]MCC4247970.1 heavy-metal-associated domain-containing protein [Microbacterium testaceum]
MNDRISLNLRDISGGPSAASTPLPEGAVVQQVGVTGMTCGHCVRSVTEEISEIAGVQGVSVDLRAGDVSRVTIASTAPIDPALVRDAVEEAGYSLVSDPA